MNKKHILPAVLLLAMLACSFPGAAVSPAVTIVSPATDTPLAVVATEQHVDIPATETPLPSPTVEPPTPTNIPHSLIPPDTVKVNIKVSHDVTSDGTAAENRAPYGDNYKFNWLERPFTQDMTYVPDLDIASFNLVYDEKFFYVSIELVGSNPNNDMGINYAVELDTNADGFGDYIVVARPPYNVNWSTDNVQVAQDTNKDTAGLSAERSDAPIPGDGYDTIIFDGGRGATDDHDLAWVRVNAGRMATVQFAFKRSLSGERFMYGVISDGAIKNIEDFDYIDRFTLEEAGSPVRSDKNYPLKKLFAVDTVCRQVFGFTGNGLEPQRCVEDL